MPRTIPAEDLESAVWNRIIAVLTDGDHLSRLASLHLEKLASQPETDPAYFRRRISSLTKQQTRVVRQLAEDDALSADALTSALGEISAELAEAKKEFERIEESLRLTSGGGNLRARADSLAEAARNQLANPDARLMAEVFDLLQVDLIRMHGRTIEGLARIPIPEIPDGSQGDPDLRSTNASVARVPVSIEIVLPHRHTP